jgi:hypothetical protein
MICIKLSQNCFFLIIYILSIIQLIYPNSIIPSIYVDEITDKIVSVS